MTSRKAFYLFIVFPSLTAIALAMVLGVIVAR